MVIDEAALAARARDMSSAWSPWPAMQNGNISNIIHNQRAECNEQKTNRYSYKLKGLLFINVEQLINASAKK